MCNSDSRPRHQSLVRRSSWEGHSSPWVLSHKQPPEWRSNPCKNKEICLLYPTTDFQTIQLYFVFVYNMDWILSSHAVTSFLFASYKMIFSFYKVEVLSIGRSQRTCFSLLWGLLRFILRKLSVWTLHRMLELAKDWLPVTIQCHQWYPDMMS